MAGRAFGHYTIIEKLGEGGMGVVYRAVDTRLKRKVALKVLAERMLEDPMARARLLREVRMASALNHPAVCTVYEVGEADGQSYIAMELVEGRSLNNAIPAGGLPADQALSYGLQIAEALAHSHEQGVLHRDLKSSNVMVTPEGRVKVLDFGLAKRPAAVAAGGETSPTHSESLTREGVIAGTLPYMSPEALRGEPAGLPSDIWSFGVLLYEMATGRLPFQGKSVFDLTAAVLREPVPELAVEGKRAEALQEMDSELLKFGELITVASNVAEFYAVLEDRAKSLEWLDRAVRAGDERTDWFERDPLLANVGKEPRYRQITDGIRYRREQRAR